nr:hypothetical protein [Tanacetum cinerariifolium]
MQNQIPSNIRSSSFVISLFSTFVVVPAMAMKKPEAPKKEKAPPASDPTKSGGGKQKNRPCITAMNVHVLYLLLNVIFHESSRYQMLNVWYCHALSSANAENVSPDRCTNDFDAGAEEDAGISLLIGLVDGVFTFLLEVALKAPSKAFVHLSGETFSAFTDDKAWQYQTFSICSQRTFRNR